MNTADLVEEYLAAMRQMKLDHARVLMAHGIPIEAIATVCPAPMRITRDGERYRPDPAGCRAWIMPVCVADPEHLRDIEAVNPIATLSVGTVIDLLTFSPAAPGRWALRLGKAVALGAVPPQYLNPAPVPVYRDVTDWLRGGCRGLVLLSRDAKELYHLLAACRSGITVEDMEHAAELRAVLGWPGRITIRPSQLVRRAA